MRFIFGLKDYGFWLMVFFLEWFLVNGIIELIFIYWINNFGVVFLVNLLMLGFENGCLFKFCIY